MENCLALIIYFELIMASYSDLLHLELQIETQLGFMKELIWVIHMDLDCWMGKILGVLLVFHTDQRTCCTWRKTVLAYIWSEN